MPAKPMRVVGEKQIAAKELELAGKIDAMVVARMRGPKRPQRFIGAIHHFGLGRGSIYVEIHPALDYQLFHQKPFGKGRMRSEKLASLREAALRILKNEKRS